MASRTIATSPSSIVSSEDFANRENEIQPVRPRVRRNPFSSQVGSPIMTRTGSLAGSSTGLNALPEPGKFFHSRRIKKGEQPKPWAGEKISKTERAAYWIPWTGVLIGLALSGFAIYEGLSSVTQHNYCPVMIDDFSNGFDSKIWTKEVQVGGFGNGQFEQTTNTEENVFIQNGQLHIKPTLQDAHLIDTNNVINLLDDHSCTGTTWSDCVAVTNTTNSTIVNPVKSGRINTKIGASIRYGRVEVVAKMPRGDWLWPAIWMMPVNETYGAWPASGEIDIAETRGNNYTYPLGGNDIVSGTLHWGPDPASDKWWLTNDRRKALLSSYSDKFHTYGLEWSEKYLFIYVDNRLQQVLYRAFNTPFWQLGQFPPSSYNGSRNIDPWSQTGHDSTPFDQNFYLIINVAVGGTNGWFRDGVGGKTWVDASPSAKADFWNSRDQWYPSWQKGDAEMVIKSVKMWQQQGYNGCNRGSKISTI